MTSEEVAALRGIVGLFTPGEWRLEFLTAWAPAFGEEQGCVIATGCDPYPDGGCVKYAEPKFGSPHLKRIADNMRGIVALRNAAVPMLDEIDRLREALKPLAEMHLAFMRGVVPSESAKQLSMHDMHRAYLLTKEQP